MATSGTFSKSWASGYWSSSSNKKNYNWTGNWSRSGNTITLSNMKLWMTFSQTGYASGVKDYVTVTGGSKQTVTWAWSGGSSKSNTVSLNNTSFSVGTTATSATINCVIDGENTGSTSISFDPGVSKPSGLSATLNSCTYNSVNVTGAVSNWGGNAQRLLLAVFNSSATGWSGARKEIEHSGPTTSTTSWASQTIDNSARCGTDSSAQVCYTLTGCAPFKIGITAINAAGQSTVLNSTVYYLPPAPLVSASHSITAYTTTTETHKVVWTGAATTGTTSTNYADAKVNNQYRYSTDNGSTWTDWTNANTNVSPSAEASFTYAFPTSSTCKVQVRQVTNQDTSRATAVKELSFTTKAYAYVDLNFYLDGASSTAVAKADVYINGTKVSSQVNDYYTVHPQGTTYKINNITYDNTRYCRNVGGAPTEYTGTVSTTKANVNVYFLTVTNPSGLSVSVDNATWNTVTLSGKVTSYGIPDYSADRYLEVGVLLNDGESSTYNNSKAVTTLTSTVNNNSHHWGTKYTICGAMPFYGTCYASNTVGTNRVTTTDLHYTAPSPLESVTVTTAGSSTQDRVTVTAKIKGGSRDGVHNYENAKVNVQYRYSTNNGSTWTNWQTVATNVNPDDVQTVTYNTTYNTASKIQARQLTYNAPERLSEAFEVSVAPVEPSSPKNLSTSLLEAKYGNIRGTATVGDYGDPASVSGRYIEFVVHKIRGGATKRVRVTNALTTGAVTITNSSTSEGDWTLKGCTPFYIGAHADNTIYHSGLEEGTIYYMPPAPVEISVSQTEENLRERIVLSIKGGEDNEDVDAVTSYRYKVADGEWSEWTSFPEGNIKDTHTADIGAWPYSMRMTVEAKQTYQGVDSDVTVLPFNVTNPDFECTTYCSVNGTSKRVERLYASVNGKTKRIIKLYGSVDGKTKLIFGDAS